MMLGERFGHLAAHAISHANKEDFGRLGHRESSPKAGNAARGIRARPGAIRCY
jgi:hypothetical protein